MAADPEPQVLVTEFWKGRPRVAWTDHERKELSQSSSSIKDGIHRAFLPEGWPESVTSDYLDFQLWDSIQAVCSYVRGMLTSQAIMRGIGVGKEASTPLGAVFQFFVRDLTGMVGGILFAYYEGSSFDSCAKQWRLFADIANNFGMVIEMLSPLFPSIFLFLACLGSFARALTGVAAGATRAALTQHFACRGNAADISAKEQSQETAVTVMGMLLGMLFTKLTAGNHTSEWSLFTILTVLHVWSNVRAMRALVLKSLNQPRVDCLVKKYINDVKVATPLEMSSIEDLTPPPFKRAISVVLQLLSRFGLKQSTEELLPIEFGAQLEPVSDGKGTNGVSDKVRRLIKDAGSQRYILLPGQTCIKVILHMDASSLDILRAYVHAKHVSMSTAAAACPLNRGDLAAASEAWMKESYESFRLGLSSAGWQLDRIRIPQLGWTASWRLAGNHHKD